MPMCFDYIHDMDIHVYVDYLIRILEASFGKKKRRIMTSQLACTLSCGWNLNENMNQEKKKIIK